VSERPSPYDAGLGPIASNPEKPDNFRRYLHGEPRKRFAGVMKETIFWRRIGEGLSPPRDQLILVLTESMVFPGQCDTLGVFRNASYCIPIPNPLAWAEWPEGPSTCNGDEDA